ncbi:MAG: hypothetical protein QNJ54_11920 [Prochloraceae cyanobacterium]|nr:hypothetical protein [Prochloraceae cyanobacterium]
MGRLYLSPRAIAPPFLPFVETVEIEQNSGKVPKHKLYIEIAYNVAYFETTVNS